MVLTAKLREYLKVTGQVIGWDRTVLEPVSLNSEGCFEPVTFRERAYSVQSKGRAVYPQPWWHQNQYYWQIPIKILDCREIELTSSTWNVLTVLSISEYLQKSIQMYRVSKKVCKEKLPSFDVNKSNLDMKINYINATNEVLAFEYHLFQAIFSQ